MQHRFHQRQVLASVVEKGFWHFGPKVEIKEAELPIPTLIISWEPALETLMSVDRVVLLLSKKKHCKFRQ